MIAKTDAGTLVAARLHMENLSQSPALGLISMTGWLAGWLAH